MSQTNSIPDLDTSASSTVSRPEVRVRSLSGMSGIAVRHSTRQASPHVLPTTSDIQKAWRSAIRARAVTACKKCRKARAKCSDMRPCPRCVKHGVESSCEGTESQAASSGARASGEIN
eukprot:CAMPEP_0172197504 /NCGR_PEP_ID=MMETSP1050-20130122/27505_1 /TAXON_ID=233186 /ORGANISM="Cryptomonas curvata, Strain CCAP979/52" /LENGTH=117 /DNA_ID=CAMNT_0012874095 /DNA_START=394 /DNA_END=744 /DNA_ORIENTATION=-